MDKNKDRKKKRLFFTNFKKLVPVLMAFALIVSPALGIGKAFADTGFVAPTQYSVSAGVVNPNNAIDGNTSTYATFPTSGSNTSRINMPSGDSTVRIYSKADSSGTYTVTFYNGNTALTTVNPSVGTSVASTDLTVPSGTTSFSVIWSSSSSSFYLYEVEVGNPPVVTHTEVTGLASSVSGQSVSLNWNAISGNSNFTKFNVYRDGSLISSPTSNSYVDSGLSYSSNHSYKVTAVYNDGFETTGQTVSATIGSDPSSLPPNAVSGLNDTNLTDTGVTLNWTPSSSTTVTGYNIYQNGSLIKTINDPTVNTYSVSGLSGSTQYSFDVTAFTSESVESTKSNIVITTKLTADITAPNAPTGLKVGVMDSALGATWNANSESDLAGYNVYVNGSLVNTGGLIKNTNYTIDNLTDDTAYSVQISAVDTSGNESALTASVSGTPKASAVPIIKTNYSLADVATGVENWFASYWLIIAFASAIPLSFYIASRIKLMFLD